MDYERFAFKYAWNYFSLHAAQRLQSVYFFLIAAAFLTAAYGTALVNDLYIVGVGVGILGAAVAMIFYRIERRVRALVHAAEAALKPIEKVLAGATGNPSLDILTAVEVPKSGAWPYSKVFRYLYWAVGLAFVGGVVYALWLLAGSAPLGPAQFSAVLGVGLAVSLLVAGYKLIAMAMRLDRASGQRPAEAESRWLRWIILGLGGAAVLAGLVACVYMVLRWLPGLDQR